MAYGKKVNFWKKERENRLLEDGKELILSEWCESKDTTEISVTFFWNGSWSACASWWAIQFCRTDHGHPGFLAKPLSSVSKPEGANSGYITGRWWRGPPFSFLKNSMWEILSISKGEFFGPGPVNWPSRQVSWRCCPKHPDAFRRNGMAWPILKPATAAHLDLIANPKVKEVFYKRANYPAGRRFQWRIAIFLKSKHQMMQPKAGGPWREPFKPIITHWGWIFISGSPRSFIWNALVTGGMERFMKSTGTSAMRGFPRFIILNSPWWVYRPMHLRDLMTMTEDLFVFIAQNLLGGLSFPIRSADWSDASLKRISVKDALCKTATSIRATLKI